MLLGMGTESNIVITAMTRTTNGMELVIGYPDTFTNRLDVYRSTDLVEMDWQQVASALTTTGTNRIDWVDTGYDTGDIGFYAVGNHDLDTDGDGFSDAFEILVLGTDPHDPASHGVYLSGDVLYSGPETGTIYVQAVTESADAWSKTWQTVFTAPGPYTNLVANQQAYWFKAYLDVSGNQQHEEWDLTKTLDTEAVPPEFFDIWTTDYWFNVSVSPQDQSISGTAALADTNIFFDVWTQDVTWRGT